MAEGGVFKGCEWHEGTISLVDQVGELLETLLEALTNVAKLSPRTQVEQLALSH